MPPESKHRVERAAFDAMRTRFELVWDAGDRDHATRVALTEQVMECIADCEARFSFFRRDSFLAGLIREAARREVLLSEEDFALFETLLEVHLWSFGAFDPCVSAWRRQGSQGDCPKLRELVELDERKGSIRLGRSVPMDLGGIAKGHALDLAANELRELGVDCFFLHGGTSSGIARGKPPGREAWGLRVGDDSQRTELWLKDEAYSVSRGDSQSCFQDANAAGHLLDPNRDGAVAEPRVAWCVATSARRADAVATALCVRPTLPQPSAVRRMAVSAKRPGTRDVRGIEDRRCAN